MNLYIIAACIAFAISFAVMLYYNKVFWYKIATITILFAIANMVYFSLDSVKGWPSHDKIHKGELVFVQVVEPGEGYPGAIYLLVRVDPTETSWYSPYINYVYWDNQAPRSYYIPYTEKTAKEMRDAQQAMEQGYIVEINGDSASEESGNQNGEPNANGKDGGSSPEGGDSTNYEVPHLKLIDPRERSGKVQQ